MLTRTFRWSTPRPAGKPKQQQQQHHHHQYSSNDDGNDNGDGGYLQAVVTLSTSQRTAWRTTKTSRHNYDAEVTNTEGHI